MEINVQKYGCAPNILYMYISEQLLQADVHGASYKDKHKTDLVIFIEDDHYLSDILKLRHFWCFLFVAFMVILGDQQHSVWQPVSMKVYNCYEELSKNTFKVILATLCLKTKQVQKQWI